MSVIREIKAREILDSRGNPTVEVSVITENFMGTASVPSGASTGEHEALELRDGGKRFHGEGVLKAVRNVGKKIAPLLLGIDCTNQREIDSLMIEKDGYENKSKLGANSMLAVSLACARAAASAKGMFLFEYLNEFPQMKSDAKLPKAFFNIINGGKHADNKLSFQEFMVVPKLKSFSENLRAGSEIYHSLKKILHKKYGKGATNVGDEGGFAPLRLKKATDALDLLVKAINVAGYKGKVDLAIDTAASEFFKRGNYLVDGKKMKKDKLLEYYLALIKKYPVISIEDPFEQEDFASFALLREKGGIQIVGDDLTVTNPLRIEAAIKERSCNCLLLKVNQIGTLTEALDAAKLARDAGWSVMVSHRSGETEDTFIADLAVALGSMLKAGAPCRGERTAKYNSLLRIDELLR
jgi:enolase